MLKDVYDVAKDAFEFAKNAGLVELQQILLDLQEKSSDLLKKNRELEDSIKAFNDSSALEKQFKRIEKKTYMIYDHNGVKRHICTACWSHYQKVVDLASDYDGYYKCYSKDCGNYGHFQ